MYDVVVKTSARDFHYRQQELQHKTLEVTAVLLGKGVYKLAVPRAKLQDTFKFYGFSTVTAADRAAFIKLYLEYTQ